MCIQVVADEAWDVYKQRNDSFVVDLLQGQYKSKLVCPVCNKVSLEKRKKTLQFIDRIYNADV